MYEAYLITVSNPKRCPLMSTRVAAGLLYLLSMIDNPFNDAPRNATEARRGAMNLSGRQSLQSEIKIDSERFQGRYSRKLAMVDFDVAQRKAAGVDGLYCWNTIERLDLLGGLRRGARVGEGLSFCKELDGTIPVVSR